MNKRPVNLDLTKFRFPPMAIVSIGHRISGVLIFLLTPFMLYLLGGSLRSSTTFANLQKAIAEHHGLKFGVWVLLSVVLFHLFAGIRHLIMDMGYGESLPAGRFSAYLVFALSIVGCLLTGVWLW